MMALYAHIMMALYPRQLGMGCSAARLTCVLASAQAFVADRYMYDTALNMKSLVRDRFYLAALEKANSRGSNHSRPHRNGGPRGYE